MSIQYKDYYKILGLSHSAKDADIQQAFRTLARKYHPDLNKTKQAEERFKEINEAYEVLRDASKRQKYDSLENNKEVFQQYANSTTSDNLFRSSSFLRNVTSPRNSFSDFFQTFFAEGSPSVFKPKTEEVLDGQTVETVINVSAAEAVNGTTKEVSFEFIDTDIEGVQKRTSKKFRIKIPAGSAPGTIIRLAGQGAPGANGGKVGDLLLKLNIQNESDLKIAGLDIIREVPVSSHEAALGTEVMLNTMKGKIKLKVPPEAQTGQKLKIPGYGLESAGESGNLVVELRVGEGYASS